MLLRDFLLRIHLCQGIGIVGKTKIYQWLNQHPTANVTLPSLEELIQIANVRGKNVTLFSSTYIQLMNDDRLVAKLVAGEKWLCICDEDYPLQLKEAYTPPLILFYRGNIKLLKTRLLGIVGARNATHYSMDVLRKLIPGPISTQMTVVSGLAMGVDTWSHQCVIANQGRTIAVIGTGLDVVYPRMNSVLQAQIGREHLLVTEYPNGTPGYRNHFPERNRIIAGLIETILVTEAKHHSGSLITANLALQNNRNVLAVPRQITSELSVGTNELIAAGAKPVLHQNDILSEYIS